MKTECQAVASAYNGLALREKISHLQVYLFERLQQFPKCERYTLCAEIRQTTYNMMRITLQVERKYYKKTSLQELDTENQLLLEMIRLAYAPTNKYINPKQYEILSRRIVEIGKIIGALIKKDKEKK